MSLTAQRVIDCHVHLYTVAAIEGFDRIRRDCGLAGHNIA
jgi:hypothetical protein